MSYKDELEKKLEELGQTVGRDDSIVDAVMSRIEAKSFSESKRFKNKFLVRKIIMNRFTRLAAAAVIIIATVLSITILDNSVTPAYAIEQTIEAFKNIQFMHIVRQDESGQIEDERWIEIGPDGIQARYRQDTPPNFFVVDNRENVLVYRKDKNTMLLYGPGGERYTWIWNPGEWFKDLAGEGSVTIEENVDYWGRKAHLVRWLELNQNCYIDPESKLPIAMGDYEISYEYPPEGTFDIVIPDGVTVVDKRPGAEPVEEPEWMGIEGTVQQMFNEARKASVAREYGKAIELLEKVVEIQPGRNWAWFWMGKAHYELGEYDLAIYEFSKVVEMWGDVPSYCHIARGFAYQAKGMKEMARRDFDIALPAMIDALRHIEGAGLFDLADDPLCCADGFLEEGCRDKPSKEQSLAMMINRLRIVTGQNFGYDPDASTEENEQVIAAWEDWSENSGEVKFSPDAELVAVPEAAQELSR